MGSEMLEILYQTPIVADYSLAIPVWGVFVAILRFHWFPGSAW